jgi:hypothetical protein
LRKLNAITSSNNEKLNGLGIGIEELKNFKLKLLYSGVNSIDEFLSANDGYAQIGKRLIVFLINKFEVEHKLINLNNSWLKYIWNNVSNGVHEIENLKTDNIKFITFNYDRNIEHFFYRALNGKYGARDSKKYIDNHKENLIPVHVYGEIGHHNLFTNKSLSAIGFNDYNGEQFESYKELEKVADNLLLFSETVDNGISEQISNMYNWANRVVFLGFGYHEDNMQHFNTLDLSKAIGTTYGLSGRQSSNLTTKFKINRGLPAHQTNQTCLDFLIENGV